MTPTESNRHRVAIPLDRIEWRVIDDDVMGGLSHGRWRLREGTLEFHGELSTENGGGFSSIRGRLPEPLEMRRVSGFRLLAEGDGREYQLRLRDSNASQAIAFRAAFRADEHSTPVELAVERFQPVVRGRAVEVLPTLAQRSIRYVGFMLNTDRPGPFHLRVSALDLEFSEEPIG